MRYLLANKMFLASSFVLMALVLVTMSATPAMAARGGKGGGGNNSTSAVLTVGEFGSAGAGESFDINGSGFKSGSTAYVGVKYYCCLEPVEVGGDGTFSLASDGLSEGTYTAVAMVYAKKNWVIAAEKNFTVGR